MTGLFRLLTTDELENIIRMEYYRLKSVAEKDGIYRDLDRGVFFAKNIPNGSREGIYIFADIMGYHYVGINERGEERRHKVTDDIFEICFWVFNDQTSLMSTEFEVNNRKGDQEDHRRSSFAKRLELLGEIGANYKKRGEIAIDEILKIAPYDDLASFRARLAKKYRDEGISSDKAWEMACTEYPLP